jgi:hypothetical protein
VSNRCLVCSFLCPYRQLSDHLGEHISELTNNLQRMCAVVAGSTDSSLADIRQEIRCDPALCIFLCAGTVRRGAMRCDAMRCGAMLCDAVRCGAVR